MLARTQARPQFLLPLFAAMAFFLASCSDGLLMDGQAPSDRALVTRLTSFSPGKVQLASDDLVLQLAGTDAATWQVTLLSSKGKVLLQKSVEATTKQAATLSKLDWEAVLASPDVTPRLTFKATVVAKGQANVDVNVDFFLFRSLPQLSVSTVPVEVEPAAWMGSQAWLAPEDASQFTHGGWIVWKVGGKTLAEGALSDRSLFWWKAQSQAGTSEMAAEWYPEQPSADVAVPAPVTVVSRPVVTTTPRPIAGELVPEDSYAALWHFRGTLTDRVSGLALKPSGSVEPSWTISHGSLAAWIPEGASLVGPGIEGLRGAWRPWTLNLQYKPTATASPLVLFETLDAAGKPLFQIQQLPGNFLVARVLDSSGVAQEVGGHFALPDDFSALSLAVYPAGDDWSVNWSLNGVAVESGTWTKARGLPESLGGASQRWSGPALWDEAGFYVKAPTGENSTDPDVFARSLQDLYGSDLVLAEGFDGLLAPSGWTVPKQGPHLEPVLRAGETLVSAPVTVPAGLLEFSAVVKPAKAALSVLVLDSSDKVLWTGTPSTDGSLTWNRRDNDPVTVRIEWKNSSPETVSLDELSIIRKMK